jgi:hypothetical protein
MFHSSFRGLFGKIFRLTGSVSSGEESVKKDHRITEIEDYEQYIGAETSWIQCKEKRKEGISAYVRG